MGSGIYVKGQKYVSSKDAGTISGYTLEQVETLCQKGELRSQFFGNVRFVEEYSFLEHLKRNFHNKENIQKEKLEINKNLEERFISSDMGRFMMVIGGICVIVLFAIFAGGSFRGGIQNLKITVTNIPSSYNSTKFINNNFGMMAVVGGGNNTTKENVEISSQTFYDSMVIVIRGMHDLILKIDNTEQKEEVEKKETQQYKTDTSQMAAPLNDKGIVITPSKDKQTDTETIEQIKNTFSDEVRIIPDGSGKSGIIQPIFRDKKGDEYIYVLVPIQEDDK